MHKTLKACIRIAIFFTRCSFSSKRYTDRVKRLTKVSRSEVVKKIFPNFNFSTLHMVSMDICICGVQSQFPSLLDCFDLPDFPERRAGIAVAGFSAALTSTAERAHCSKNPYISSSCLCCCTASCSSASRSLWMMSASTARPDTIRSRILLKLFDGKTVQHLFSKPH